jgi:hypothetical protein
MSVFIVSLVAISVAALLIQFVCFGSYKGRN